MAHVWMSRVTRINESCRRCEYITSFLCASRHHMLLIHMTHDVTHSYDSWCSSFIWLMMFLIHTTRMLLIHMTHDVTHSYDSWWYSFIWLMMLLIHMTHDVTHSYDSWCCYSFIWLMMLLIHMTHDGTRSYDSWCYSFIWLICYSFIWLNKSRHSYVTHSDVSWLIHTCDMTHSHVWHDSPGASISSDMTHSCVTSLIYTRDMTHSHVWHDPSTCVPWLAPMYFMTHDSFTCMTWLMTYSQMYHDSLTWLVTHSHVWHDPPGVGSGSNTHRLWKLECWICQCLILLKQRGHIFRGNIWDLVKMCESVGFFAGICWLWGVECRIC